MRQATVNLFADMGVQPSTLQSGLVAATASADTLPPGTAISSSATGATFAPGTWNPVSDPVVIDARLTSANDVSAEHPRGRVQPTVTVAQVLPRNSARL